jgi:hypothetical protein
MKRFVRMAAALVACSVAAATSAQEWIPLQDGKSLAGWKAAERPESWVVEEGAFVSRGDRSHLFYVGKVGPRNRPADFRNFELSLDVMTSPGANSGVYVHTKWQGPGWPEAGYELQVINSNPPAESMNGYVEHKMTGSIYAVRNTWIAPVKDGEWFNYRIRVVGKTIQTFINGKLVCEYAEPADAFRPDDKKLRRLGSGTIALQAHDPGSVVKYRDIKVKILPDDAVPRAGLVAIEDRELDQLITQASNDNIPLIDLDLAPAQGADEKAFWSDARRYGITPFRRAGLPPMPSNVAVFNDRERSPAPEVLKSLKQQGYRFAFLSGARDFDEAQIKRRLKAIRDAGLGWKDFWVPGKP